MVSLMRLPLLAQHLGLSEREADVLASFFSLETEAEVAARLGLSQHTVHTYVQRIYKKLNTKDRCSTVVRIFATYLALFPSADIPGL